PPPAPRPAADPPAPAPSIPPASASRPEPVTPIATPPPREPTRPSRPSHRPPKVAATNRAPPRPAAPTRHDQLVGRYNRLCKSYEELEKKYGEGVLGMTARYKGELDQKYQYMIDDSVTYDDLEKYIVAVE